MKLKEVISLKFQKDIYLVEEAEADFTYGLQKISKYCILIKCRKKKCPRILHLLHNLLLTEL